MTLRRAAPILVVWMITGSVLGNAQDRSFGLGIILGEPTGVSAKYWVSSRNAVDAGAAWAFSKNGFVDIHSDYLWHFPDVIQSKERFVLYAGVGGRLGLGGDKVKLGVRVPGGLAYWPKGVPIDVFLELAPILDLIPATVVSLNGGLGIRYFFD